MTDRESLDFQSVVKTYRRRAAVCEVSLSAPRGKITALVGVNGSGKSTLFKVAAGFERADSGHVVMHRAGHQPLFLDIVPAAQRVKAGLTYVGQERRFLRTLSTLDHLKCAAAARAFSVAGVLSNVDDLRLRYLFDRKPVEMTAGERTSLALACAYLRRPHFLILDEPFAGLDAKEVTHNAAIIRNICDGGTGILMSDHNVAHVLDLADLVHIMQDGRLMYSDSAEGARYSARAAQLYFRKHV